MGERLIVSGGDALRVYTGFEEKPGMHAAGHAALEGAGALCAGEKDVFAASDQGNVIWRFDRETLMPSALFAGGPGMCRLLLSGDGTRLYALCADADSLLMLDAHSGTPLLLARVGAGPCAMEMDESGGVIAVAGGASGEVILLDAHSLCVLARLNTCGVAMGAAIGHGNVYALSLNERMDSVLTTLYATGDVSRLLLPGLPGALAVCHRTVAAATHERLTFVSRDGRRALCSMPAPGRAGWLIPWQGRLMMNDMWSDALYMQEEGGRRWRLLMQKVRDAAVLPQG